MARRQDLRTISDELISADWRCCALVMSCVSKLRSLPARSTSRSFSITSSSLTLPTPPACSGTGPRTAVMMKNAWLREERALRSVASDMRSSIAPSITPAAAAASEPGTRTRFDLEWTCLRPSSSSFTCFRASRRSYTVEDLWSTSKHCSSKWKDSPSFACASVREKNSPTSSRIVKVFPVPVWPYKSTVRYGDSCPSSRFVCGLRGRKRSTSLRKRERMSLPTTASAV
mmetsp:Transcript_55352/g.129545  ORF Transcript_55352/g.129545 Transcript_55352/m.129545 type:complete len:229 (-) Transcript_55352:689-1375(-)